VAVGRKAQRQGDREEHQKKRRNMSTRKGGVTRGNPKHQNAVVWKPNSGVKKNEKELGGKFRPYAEITGVCPRCKQQIEWRRKYGKYKPLTEPAKCHDCGKRSVRQAYHTLCTACSKQRNVCAKCCHPATTIIGSNVDEEEEERRQLEEAVKNMRERDRRTVLRTMAGGTGTRQSVKLTNSDEKDDSDSESEADDEDTEGQDPDSEIPTEDEAEDEDDDNENQDDNIKKTGGSDSANLRSAVKQQ
jgi:hypothetical protein